MFRFIFISLFSATLCFSANADEQEALELLNNTRTQSSLLNTAVIEGKSRSSLCGYCHGSNGSSERDYIPNLAGQSPEYLLHQFQLFSTGERKQTVMEELSKNLSNQDMVNLSLFYSSELPVRRFDVQGDAESGKRNFDQYCQACHGVGGVGIDKAPRLASQPQTYLKRTLNNLKSGKQIRSVPEMAGVLTILDDKLITDISAYLAAIE